MKAMEFTSQNFEEQVLKSDMPVLVDFYATWCGPCKMLSPIVDQLAEEYDGKVKVGKLNTDENRDIAEKYNILSIPTILCMKNGEIVDTIMGAVPKKKLEEKLAELV